MLHGEKMSIIRFEWAKATQHISTLTDDELIALIDAYEKEHVAAHARFECAKTQAAERAKDMRSKFASEQREADRKYHPKPNDKVEYDRQARKERTELSKEEKAIQMMVKTGMSEEKAREIFYAAKNQATK